MIDDLSHIDWDDLNNDEKDFINLMHCYWHKNHKIFELILNYVI